MKKIKKAVKKIASSNYRMREWFNRLQDWRKARYYKSIKNKVATDDKVVVFESFLGKQYACSPKAIYQAMLKDPRFSDFTFIWVFRDADGMRAKLGDERTVVVKYGSRQYLRAYAKAKYWVTNWRLSSSLQKKSDQVCIQCWHGTPLKKIGMDLKIEGNATTSQKRGHLSYLNDAKKYDYFVSPSRFCTKAFTSSFGLDRLGKEDILIETGYPRNDALFELTDVSIVSMKEELNIPLDKKVVLYAPTWRDNQHKLGVGYTFDDSQLIAEFLDEISDDYVVIVRLHYLIAETLDLSAYRGKVFDYSKLDDINQLYAVSDVLITDYSSVFFDYANLRRPILFYMYDLESYSTGVRDFYLDLDELPGPIVKDRAQLLDALYRIDEVSGLYAEKYRRFNETYNYLDDSKAGQRVIDRCIR